MRKRRYKKFRKFSFRLNSKLIWIGSLCFFAIILFLGLGYAIYTLEIFKVKEEDIESNVSLNGSLKNMIVGKSLFTLDIESISLQLLKEHPEYKKASVLKKFPSTVVIEVEKRIPIAQIKGKKFYPIDKEAIILSEGEAQPLKELIPIEISDYNNFFTRGHNIKDERLETAFNLIEILREENFFKECTVKSINATDLEVLCFFMDCKSLAGEKLALLEDIKIIIGKENFRGKIKLLKNLINQKLKDKISLVKYIDLRFKKVYVGFKR